MTLSVGGQRYFHDQYNAYLNVDVSLFASNLMDSVINQLLADIRQLPHREDCRRCASRSPSFGWRVASCDRVDVPREIAGVLAPHLRRRLVLHSRRSTATCKRPRRTCCTWRPSEVSSGRSWVSPINRSRFAHAPGSRCPVVLAAPPPAGRRPNVLFVILESVRADAVCIEPDPDCRRTPNRMHAVPDRFPFPQMRSLDSSTAISLAVLWSGVGPTESRDVLHTWPLVFDYASAAGYDTAFWTSQNMMFGNARLWVKNLGVSQMITATDLDPTSDLDMGAPEDLLAEHVSAAHRRAEEPFLAVVQLSNMHYPYFVDPAGPMPFEPWTTSKAPEDNPHFYNYYLNGVHQQDEHVATILDSVKKSALGDHTVIVYTSDHAEAFRDHGQMGHTFSVLDEEIHVPAWIDAPPGSLRADQEREPARRAARVPVPPGSHRDDPGRDGRLGRPGHRSSTAQDARAQLAPRRRRRPSHAADELRRRVELRLRELGLMQKNLKVEARAWDLDWHCYDVEQRSATRSTNLDRAAWATWCSLAHCDVWSAARGPTRCSLRVVLRWQVARSSLLQATCAWLRQAF